MKKKKFYLLFTLFLIVFEGVSWSLYGANEDVVEDNFEINNNEIIQSLMVEYRGKFTDERHNYLIQLVMTPVTSSEKLVSYCEELKSAEFITLDTEFVNNSELCLIQIGGPKLAFAIDVLCENLDLSPFYKLMQNPKIFKVFYDMRKDLELLKKEMISRGIPGKVYFNSCRDTGTMAKECRMSEFRGYANLLRGLTEIDIDKNIDHKWKTRPLTESRMLYALNDVVYLRPVYEELLYALENNDELAKYYDKYGKIFLEKKLLLCSGIFSGKKYNFEMILVVTPISKNDEIKEVFTYIISNYDEVAIEIKNIYSPKLKLKKNSLPSCSVIQIAVFDMVFIIDAKDKPELSPLFAMLKNAKIMKIIFEPEIFNKTAEFKGKKVNSVFSVLKESKKRLSYLENQKNLSSTKLAETILDTGDEKNLFDTREQIFNKRPLSDNAIEGALKFVSYLLPMYHELIEIEKNPPIICSNNDNLGNCAL
ncbi:MAG: hypothetical protein H6731_10425 [Myxococcales bacterium]|nr:MAG: hypothetical protein H6731_10425 [Myxococcales bacterium]